MSEILLYFLEYIYNLLVDNLMKQCAPFVRLYALSIDEDFNFKLLEVGLFLAFYLNWVQSSLRLHLLQSL